MGQTGWAKAFAPNEFVVSVAVVVVVSLSAVVVVVVVLLLVVVVLIVVIDWLFCRRRCSWFCQHVTNSSCCSCCKSSK